MVIQTRILHLKALTSKSSWLGLICLHTHKHVLDLFQCALSFLERIFQKHELFIQMISIISVYLFVLQLMY